MEVKMDLEHRVSVDSEHQVSVDSEHPDLEDLVHQALEVSMEARISTALEPEAWVGPQGSMEDLIAGSDRQASTVSGQTETSTAHLDRMV